MLTLKKLNKLSEKAVLKKLRKYRNLSYIHKLGDEPLKPLTLGKLLEEKCKEEGDKPLLISKHQNQKISFIDVLNQADRLAAGLRSKGLNHGDRVGIWAPNLTEWYLTNMACARAGLILVCVNPALQSKEVEYAINKVSMKAIVCPHKFKTQNYYEILNEIAPEISNSEPGRIKSKNLPSLQTVIMIDNDSLKGTYYFQEILSHATENEVKIIKANQNTIQPDDPCHIQFTSGTTGQPKAAIHTHFALVNNSYQIGKRVELNKKHHTACVLVPFFHAFATDVVINSGLNHGSTLVLPSPSFNADKALDSVLQERCTIMYGTPTMYVDLLVRQKARKEPIVSLDYAVWGGASASPHLVQEMKKYLNLKKVKAAFGMTETTSVTFQTLPDDDEDKAFSTVGYLSDHLEAKVVDSQGKIVPRGEPGELYIRGFNTIIEYWQDEAKTKELIGRDRWLKTGDQFVIDEEGYGHVVGRLKEVIIRGGENIYPREIEDFLNTHPDIVETHVIGLPDERLGEQVCACVRIHEEVENLSLEDLRKFCRHKIAHFKIPEILKIVETFPKTQSGKIQKFKLVEIFS